MIRSSPAATPETLRAEYQASPVTSLPRAGAYFGISGNTCYELHKRGEFPVRVLTLGRKLQVPIADIAAALGIKLDSAGTGQDGAHLAGGAG